MVLSSPYSLFITQQQTINLIKTLISILRASINNLKNVSLYKKML